MARGGRPAAVAIIAVLVGAVPSAAAERAPWAPGVVAASYAAPGGRVRVHYVTTTADAVPTADGDGDGVPDFVAAVAGHGDHALAVFAAAGFRPPRGDGALGGDDRLDVYLRDLAGADGSFTADTCTPSPFTCAGHVTIENDFVGYRYPTVDEAIRVLTSHELFHAVQAAYDGDQPAVWAEGSAVWAEERVFPEQSDYERLVAGFLARTYRPFERPGAGFGDPFPYGAALWPTYLEARFGAGTVETIWRACEDRGDDPDHLAAAAAVLTTRGVTLDAAWIEFTRWNARTGGRADGTGYPEAARLALAHREPALDGPGVTEVWIEGRSARYLPVRAATAITLSIVADAPIAVAALASDDELRIERAGDDVVGREHRLSVRPGPSAAAEVELVLTGVTPRSPPARVTVVATAAPPQDASDGGCRTGRGSVGLALAIALLVAAPRRRVAA